MTYLIASLAVEMKIAPSQVLEMDSDMLNAVLQVFSDKTKEAQANARSRRRV